MNEVNDSNEIPEAELTRLWFQHIQEGMLADPCRLEELPDDYELGSINQVVAHQR